MKKSIRTSIKDSMEDYATIPRR